MNNWSSQVNFSYCSGKFGKKIQASKGIYNHWALKGDGDAAQSPKGMNLYLFLLFLDFFSSFFLCNDFNYSLPVKITESIYVLSTRENQIYLLLKYCDQIPLGRTKTAKISFSYSVRDFLDVSRNGVNWSSPAWLRMYDSLYALSTDQNRIFLFVLLKNIAQITLNYKREP